MFVLIYLKQTDGDPVMETLAASQLKSRIEELKLSRYDYAIIRGSIEKSFDS